MPDLAMITTRLMTHVREALVHGDMERLDADLSRVTASCRASSPGRTHAVSKLDEEQRLVYGWALVTSEHGEALVDRQDDVVDVDDLRTAAHEFMKGDRMLGRMHRVMGVGEVVESVVLSKALQQALGIDLGCEGWFVGVHVQDDDTWSRVKKGELRMFSIGGSGERTPMTKRQRRVALFQEAWRDPA